MPEIKLGFDLEVDSELKQSLLAEEVLAQLENVGDAQLRFDTVP